MLDKLTILQALMNDSKISDRAIAQKLGVSQPTVSRQRAVLVEEGYIKKFSIIPNLLKLGYDILMISEIDPLEVNVRDEPLEVVIQRDKKIIGALANSEGLYTISRHKGIVDVEQFRTKYSVQDSIIVSTEIGLVKDFAVTTL